MASALQSIYVPTHSGATTPVPRSNVAYTGLVDDFRLQGGLVLGTGLERGTFGKHVLAALPKCTGRCDTAKPASTQEILAALPAKRGLAPG